MTQTQTGPPIDAAWNRLHNACYSDERLTLLYDRPMTLREVLTRADGEWANVPYCDRVWVACLVIDGAVRREWLARMVERSLGRIAAPDPRSVAVVPALRTNTVTPDIRYVAWDAWSAAAWPVGAAAAAWISASAAGDSAAAWPVSAAAAAAAGDRYAEYLQQIDDLVELLQEDAS